MESVRIKFATIGCFTLMSSQLVSLEEISFYAQHYYCYVEIHLIVDHLRNYTILIIFQLFVRENFEKFSERFSLNFLLFFFFKKEKELIEKMSERILNKQNKH